MNVGKMRVSLPIIRRETQEKYREAQLERIFKNENVGRIWRERLTPRLIFLLKGICCFFLLIQAKLDRDILAIMNNQTEKYVHLELIN